MTSETKMPEREPTPFDSAVGSFVKAIGDAASGEYGLLNRGDVAAMRRMDVAAPCSGFWKLVGRTEGVVNAGNESRWATVAKCMAVMAPLHHRQGVKPGHALRDAGYSQASDLRMSRLLKSEGVAFDDYLLSAVRFLSAKGKPLDWFRFARFVVDRDDRARNDLASDFYAPSKSN